MSYIRCAISNFKGMIGCPIVAIDYPNELIGGLIGTRQRSLMNGFIECMSPAIQKVYQCLLKN